MHPPKSKNYINKPGSIENYFYESFNAFKNAKIQFKNFSIFQLNVRGINNPKKYDKIKILLSQLDTKPDIIVLGETKLKTSFPSGIYNLNGYERYNCCRDAKNSGGGLITFIKRDILVQSVEKESSSFEKIKITLTIHKSNYKILCYYRNPVQESINPFLKDVENELLENDKQTIIIGDVNLDYRADNKDSARYASLMKCYDMTCTNTFKTRNDSGRIIDHCCINFKEKVTTKNYTITTRLSDHNIVITELSGIKREKVEKLIELEITNWTQLSENFNNYLSCSEIMSEMDPNVIAKQLNQMVESAIRYATRKIRFKCNKDTKICKWFNLRVMSAIRHKDNIARKCKKKRGNVILKDQLSKATRRMKRIIKEEKEKYINKSLEGSNLKVIWKNLNEILGRKSKSDGITAISDENGDTIQDPVMIAETFNKFFIESISDIKDNLTESLHPIREKSQLKSMRLEETTDEEIQQIIATLKNSAPGIDGIKSKHIKAISKDISPILVHLINKMMSTGVYPESFKTAIVTPINKSGKLLEMKDYRPVSVLTNFNKIAEKVIHKRLIDFTDGYLKIIYDKQFGYRKKSSTETAAIELISEIQMALDKKMKVSVVFMDLTRAFDLVDVNKLLLTLNNCGIRGTALSLIENYLSNRQQVVKVNGVFSSRKIYSQGVVQGSILGSWLFLLYINSMSELQLNGKLFLYADDSVLVNVHKKDEKIEETICNDMKMLINYLNNKKLLLNASKTNFMIFNPSGVTDKTEKITIKSEDEDEVKINGEYDINRVREFKYLGLIIDDELKWESQISNVSSKISNATAILWKLRHSLPLDTKKRIYKSLIESHLRYMIGLWGAANETSIKSLQVTQNRALRNVYNLDRLLNRSEMYLDKVDGTLPIKGLYFESVSGFVFKASKKLIYTNVKFHRVNVRAGRRKNDSYLKPVKTRTVKAGKDITVIGPKIFNSLSDEIKSSIHLASFRRALKIHIQQKEFIDTCFDGDFLNKFRGNG